MWTDIVDLRDFYANPLGRLARRLIARRIRAFWPDVVGKRVLGVGFAVPFLGPFQAEAERVLAAMLTDEDALPFPDRSIDRLLLVHCLEGSAHVRPFMRECWRVLADGGRLVVVVTNRRGLWSRAEATPFAQGSPYSMGQTTRMLRDNLFVPRQNTTALFVPPVWWRLFRAWAPALENLGARWFPTFAGVVIVEAEKQIYAAPFEGLPARAQVSKVLVRSRGGGVAGVTSRARENE
jgi:SAM-dependent methyltransferase